MEKGKLIHGCFLNVLGEEKCTHTQKQYISVSHKGTYTSRVLIEEVERVRRESLTNTPFLRPQCSRLSIPCFLRCSLFYYSLFSVINAFPFKKMKIIASTTSRHKQGLYFLQIKLWTGLVNRITASASKREQMQTGTDTNTQGGEAVQSKTNKLQRVDKPWFFWHPVTEQHGKWKKKMKQKINTKKSPVQAKDI